MAFPDGMLTPGEVVLYRFRPHIIIVCKAALLAIAATALYGSAMDSTVKVVTIAATVLLGLGYLNLLRVTVKWIFTCYCVTNLRVVWRNGLDWRATRQIPLPLIDHLAVVEGPIAENFEYGNVVFRSGSRRKVVWRAAPRAATVRGLFTQLHRAAPHPGQIHPDYRQDHPGRR